MLSVTISAKRLCHLLLLCVIILSLYLNIIELIGLLIIISLYFFTWQFNRLAQSNWVFALFITFSFLVGAHVLAGFSPLIIFSQVQFSPLSEYFDIKLSLDKILAATIIGMFLFEKKDFVLSYSHLRLLALPLVLGLLLLLASSLIGLLSWDPKINAYHLIWIPMNLLFTSLSEEIFFRGLLFKFFRRFNFFSIGHILLISSFLFGIAHLSAGLPFAVVATLAGGIYGWCYLRTQSLWAATICHFSVNLTHSILFAYPMAR